MRRNSRLTPDRANTILAALRSGQIIRDACKTASVSHVSFHKWMLRGEAGEIGYAEFRAAARAAMSERDLERMEELLQAIRLKG